MVWMVWMVWMLRVSVSVCGTEVVWACGCLDVRMCDG